MVKRSLRRTVIEIGLRGTKYGKLAVARDPASTAADLADVAPGTWDPEQDTELVLAVLAHPGASCGLVGRYVIHRDVEVRRVIVEHPKTLSNALLTMTYDPDEGVRAVASRRLAEEASSPSPISFVAGARRSHDTR